ncbi:hypothetical protein X801_00351, partial [Opisthorchis viverrini]|uniref:Regulator of microtubule dynamics protein 1 n=2 Tax=Opisthorchis viverrini TaxID=6198 RepID=A0A075A0U3_OPIVI
MTSKLERADELLRQNKFEEVEAILSSMPNSPDVGWRKARLAYVSTTAKPRKPSKDTLKEIYKKALSDVQEGYQGKQPNAECLIWEGICKSEYAELVGPNERIKIAYEIRDLWDRALQMEPKNGWAIGCVGIWCFNVTDLSDVKRSFAKAFFTKPPDSTYQEALDNLLKAEALLDDPRPNLLIIIAKCYYRMKDWDNVRRYCTKVMNLPDLGYEVAEVGFLSGITKLNVLFYWQLLGQG